MTLTKEDLKELQKPFDENTIGIKVQSFSKARDKAMLVAYVQHTDAYARIEQVDPAWSVKVTDTLTMGDTSYVRVALTIKGVTRENVGEGGDPKAALSDAIKRAAMLFGVGRYLYDADTVWVDYNDQRDRFKAWTYQEYKAAGRKGQAIAPAGKVEKEPALPAAKPAAGPKIVPMKGEGLPLEVRTRDELNRILMNLYRPFLSKFPETRFAPLLEQRYGVGETRLMSVEQMGDLVRFMEQQLQDVG